MLDDWLWMQKMIEEKLKTLGLRRHGPVGKLMGSNLWVHRAYADLILPSELINTKNPFRAEPDFPFDVVRFDRKTWDVCLIEAPGFDHEDEPVIGRSLLIPWSDGPLKLTSPSKNPLIYHHKWMFVADDYSGFDVMTSKRRSIWWKSQMGTDRSLSSRIGRLSFWNSWIQTLEH